MKESIAGSLPMAECKRRIIIYKINLIFKLVPRVCYSKSTFQKLPLFLDLTSYVILKNVSVSVKFDSVY